MGGPRGWVSWVGEDAAWAGEPSTVGMTDWQGKAPALWEGWTG